MSLEKYSTVKNDSKLNLSNNEVILDDFKIIKITKDINEITLTSNGEICNGAIVVKNRSNDLVINIENLKLYSREHIAIDFRGGKECAYKNYLHFKGENIIRSDKNIAICVSNNQTLEIEGYEESYLKAVSGKNMVAIGSNQYTAGAGNIIFSKEGNVVVCAGGAHKEKEDKIPWIGRDGAYALGFYNDDSNISSSIKIVDNIELKAIGEDGENIKSISAENFAGDGGAAIYLNSNDYFSKNSNGKLELMGGNGGKCIGEYSSGKCGNGGSAIKVTSGKIKIFKPALLKGGNGGAVEKEAVCVLAPGGNGGDGISVFNNNCSAERKLEVVIEDEVEIRAGNGGNSGFYMNDEGISGVNGGNGGDIIDGGPISVELELGKVKATVGIGGKGGCKEAPCKDGESGKYIVGERVVIKGEIIEENLKNEEVIYEELENEEQQEDIEIDDNESSSEELSEENTSSEESNIEYSEEEEVYNEDLEQEDNEESEPNPQGEEVEALSGDIIINNEEETGLEVYKKEKKVNFIVRFFRWLFA